MTNYCNYEVIPQLWEDILKKHWDYLEAEETLGKFEMRKELEGCLQKYLCMVPHDRKFFLPETPLVLKRSITQNADFSAYKAANGFESISQYANNLFTKPWRKEYKVIKMYSGFYQHEIKANLVDSEKLFEAMGYKLMPDQTLVLEEGAICPDQVTNVARDAMAAYVECEIMKQIYSGLTAVQLSSSWIEIFNFRETHIGGISKAVKAMIIAIQEKQQQRKNKNVAQENCYNNHQMASSAPCNSCNVYQCMPNQQHHYYNPQPPPPLPQPPQSSYHVPCSVHPHNNAFSNQNYSASYGPVQIPTTIPHSKSLDYYDPNPMMPTHMTNNGGFPNNHHHHAQHQHRHSVPDQAFVDYNPPQPQSHYDCVDGDHQCNLNTMQSYNNHPYNVSGNRVPLPYNISNELGGTSYPPQQQHLPPPPLPPSSCYTNNAEQATYYSRLQHPAQRELTYNDHQFNGNVKNVDYYCPVLLNPNQQQPHYLQSNVTSPVVPMETLIDFEQPNGTVGGTRNNTTYYEERAGKHDKQQQADNYIPTTIKSHHNGGVHHYQQTPVDLPPPLFAKNKTTRTNASIEDYNKQYPMMEKGMKNLNLSDFDSFEDDNSSSQPRSNKNMDGIGNYESWNYVFRNLEQQGYNKDLDLENDTGEELDENDGFQVNLEPNHRKSSMSRKSGALTFANSKSHEITKHHNQQSAAPTTTTNDISINGRPMHITQQKVQSNKTNTGTMTTPSNTKLEKSPNNHQQQMSNKLNASTSTTTPSHPNIVKVSNNNSFSNNNNNNNNNNLNSENRKKAITVKTSKILAPVDTNTARSNPGYFHVKKSNGSAGGASILRNNSASDNNHVAANISEWSCQFCTFLNTSERICEMCAKSRDFNLQGSKNKATCV